MMVMRRLAIATRAEPYGNASPTDPSCWRRSSGSAGIDCAAVLRARRRISPAGRWARGCTPRVLCRRDLLPLETCKPRPPVSFSWCRELRATSPRDIGGPDGWRRSVHQPTAPAYPLAWQTRGQLPAAGIAGSQQTAAIPSRHMQIRVLPGRPAALCTMKNDTGGRGLHVLPSPRESRSRDV